MNHHKKINYRRVALAVFTFIVVFTVSFKAVVFIRDNVFLKKATVLAKATSNIKTEERLQRSSSKVEQFDELLESYNFDVSVYLHLLDTDELYVYNEDTLYYPASLFKVPLALYLYQADDSGELSLDSYARGLLYQIICYSDNDATCDIAEAYGVDGERYWYVDRSDDFADFLESMGATTDICIAGSFISGEMNVMDMGCIMEALYQYFETETDNALELKSLFGNYVYDLDLLETGTQLYKKYGRYDEACHDVAIGYEPQPFILCVMTNGGDEGEEMMDPDGIMQEISEFVVENYLNN